MEHDQGIGATPDLSLRVSVATLVRVVFQHPLNGEWMLALERKSTFHEDKVEVKAQPFGGAVRINDLSAINKITGEFHFDSEQSRADQDFRILIRPSAWEELKAFCLNQFQALKEAAFETSPERELEEELYDSLGVQVNPNQYVCNPLWSVVENDPSPTTNDRAVRQSTVRIYRVFEAQVINALLWQMIMLSSNSISDHDLQNRALEDRQMGGRGRANACSVVPMGTLRQYYSVHSLDGYGARILHQGTILENNISALLDGGVNPKYQRIKD